MQFLWFIKHLRKLPCMYVYVCGECNMDIATGNSDLHLLSGLYSLARIADCRGIQWPLIFRKCLNSELS